VTWWEAAPLAGGNWWENAPLAKPQMMSESATRDEAARTQTPDEMVEDSGFKPRPGVGERFGQGVGDPVAAAAQIGSRVTPDAAFDVMRWLDERIRNNVPGFENAPAYKGNLQDTAEADRLVKQRETDYQESRGPNAGFDWMRLGGNVAAAVPIGMAAPASLPGALGAGAVTGALQPVTGSGDFLTEKAIQTGTGALAGGVGNVVGRGVARVISPKVNPDVKMLMDKGVTPTPGQIVGGGTKAFEEKLTSIPVLGDVIKGGQRRAIEQFNRAVYDEVLKPIGGTAPRKAGREAVNEVTEQLSQAYDDILPKLQFTTDRQFATEVSNLSKLVSGLPKKEAGAFKSFMMDKLAKAFGPKGQMDGRTFKELESALNKEIGTFGKSNDAYQQKLGEAFRTVLQSLRDGLTRSNMGSSVQVGGKIVNATERLQNINSGWAKLVRLQTAAASTGAKGGIFTPAQMSSAVRSADKSVRKNAFARGDALMQDLSDAGKNVIGDVYPDSGTAGRLVAMLLTGGAIPFSPTGAAVGGAAMLPYTSLGQRLAAQLMTQRPEFAPQVAAGVRASLPAVQTGLAAALTKR
jgi:hypothetical protein